MTSCIALISLMLVTPAFLYSSAEEESVVASEETSEAVVASLSWLAGHWKGSGMGNQLEEAWLPPAGGALSGIFRMVKDDKVVFYETIVIREIDGQMMMRLKHFTETLIGWEEKADTVDFIYLRQEGNRWLFKGLVIERVDADTMVISVDLQSEGVVETVPFSFKRVP